MTEEPKQKGMAYIFTTGYICIMNTNCKKSVNIIMSEAPKSVVITSKGRDKAMYKISSSGFHRLKLLQRTTATEYA